MAELGQHFANQYAKTAIAPARQHLARMAPLQRQQVLLAMVRAYTGLAAEHVHTKVLVETLCELSERLLADSQPRR